MDDLIIPDRIIQRYNVNGLANRPEVRWYYDTHNGPPKTYIVTDEHNCHATGTKKPKTSGVKHAGKSISSHTKPKPNSASISRNQISGRSKRSSPDNIPKYYGLGMKKASIHDNIVPGVPYIEACFNNQLVHLKLVSGSTCNLVLAAYAYSIGLPVEPLSRSDPGHPAIKNYDIVGQVFCNLTRDHRMLDFNAFVVRELDANIIAGCPFLVSHNVCIRAG